MEFCSKNLIHNHLQHVLVYVCVLCELGPSEEEERLRAEVKSLKDELDKSRRGTLSSQKGHDGNPYQLISFTDSTYTHCFYAPHYDHEYSYVLYLHVHV